MSAYRVQRREEGHGFRVWAWLAGSWQAMSYGDTPGRARTAYAALGFPADTRSLLLPADLHPTEYKTNRPSFYDQGR